MAGRTTLVISHRRTVAGRMDRMVVLDGGAAATAGAPWTRLIPAPPGTPTS
jgi:ABC-type multidrug transport system fused ATPase/permease subunit